MTNSVYHRPGSARHFIGDTSEAMRLRGPHREKVKKLTLADIHFSGEITRPIEALLRHGTTPNHGDTTLRYRARNGEEIVEFDIQYKDKLYTFTLCDNLRGLIIAHKNSSQITDLTIQIEPCHDMFNANSTLAMIHQAGADLQTYKAIIARRIHEAMASPPTSGRVVRALAGI